MRELFAGGFFLYELFPLVFHMSLTGSIVILAVLLLRLMLRRAPKAFSYALWAVALFRLLCPVSVSSAFSLLDPLGAPAAIVTALWLCGGLGMLIYSGLSLFRLRRKLASSVRLRDNIYLTDHIASPFVMGLFRPNIYLPPGLSGKERGYIILHEQYHIRALDHVVKLLGFAALCIHWFNPLVWLAFVLSGEDMEMRCDEAVMKLLGEGVRADYSASLLRLATGRRMIAGAPLAFGEGDTRGRIQNLLAWKKARPAAVFLAAAALALAAVVCGTNAVGGSWIKVKNSLERELEFTCDLQEPIRSWVLYEDIYENGRLVSSEPGLTADFETAGAPSRRFTGILLVEPVYAQKDYGLAGELTCSFEEKGSGAAASWTLELPKDRYTGMTAIQENVSEGLSGRRKLAAGDSVVLYTVLLSTEANGAVTTQSRDMTLMERNDTVVRFRLATSAGDLETLTSQRQAPPSADPKAIFEQAQAQSEGIDGSLKLLDSLCRTELWGDAVEEPPSIFWPGNFGPSARFEQVPADPEALDVAMARRAILLMRLRPVEISYVMWSYPGADGAAVNRMLHQDEMVGIMSLSSHTRTYRPIESSADLEVLIGFLGGLDERVFLGCAGDGNDLSPTRLAEAEAVWFAPEDIRDIEYAELVWQDGRRFTPLTGEGYTYLQERLSSASEIRGGTACPFEAAVLYLHRSDGVAGKIVPAADTCDVFLSDGQYYQYGNRSEPPRTGDSGGFYACFGVSVEELPRHAAPSAPVRQVEMGEDGAFSDVLGYDGYMEAEGSSDVWEIRTYMAVENGEAFPIAESFGFDGTEDYRVDLDGDGMEELVANVQYGGDGHEDVYVYKRVEEGAGGIRRGILDLSDLPGHDDWGVNSTAAEYDPEENLFRVRYAQKGTEEYAVLETRGLERIVFSEFVPLA